MSANSHVSHPAKPLLIPSKRKGIPIDAIIRSKKAINNFTCMCTKKCTSFNCSSSKTPVFFSYIKTTTQ